MYGYFPVQNTVHTPYVTVCMVISLPKIIPCTHRIYLLIFPCPKFRAHTVCDRMYGCPKYRAHTPYIPINVWFWPSLFIYNANIQLALQCYVIITLVFLWCAIWRCPGCIELEEYQPTIQNRKWQGYSSTMMLENCEFSYLQGGGAVVFYGKKCAIVITRVRL